MLTAVAIASIFVVSDAADFFPLNSGRSWVYSDSGIQSEGYVDSVGNSQPIAGKDATPIVTTFNNKVDGSTFYRVEDDTVWVVAFEQNRPLTSPYPLFKVGSGAASWSYTGSTQWLSASTPMTMVGKSKRIGKKEYFGETREVLEVTVDATIGPPGQVNMKSHQVSLYAKGIGLVELKDKTTINKDTSERKRVLLSFGPGS